MRKKAISIFFLFSFTVFMVAPTVLSVLDSSYNISYFFSLNEEENKSNETLKKFEFEVFDLDKYLIAEFKSDNEHHLGYYSKLYTALSLESVSPPPEQNIFS